MRYILALDQGTTSTRAIVFDKNRKIVGKAQQEFEQLYPRAGWVEHAPRDIFGTAMGVIAEALVRADADTYLDTDFSANPGFTFTPFSTINFA